MTKPTFLWQLSIGNVIQIAMLLLAAGIGWATFDARISSLEKVTDGIVASQVDQSVRLRTAENSMTRSDERMANILNMLTRIDSRLERIEQAR